MRTTYSMYIIVFVIIPLKNNFLMLKYKFLCSTAINSFPEKPGIEENYFNERISFRETVGRGHLTPLQGY